MGWWQLKKHYGENNGKWCCRAGCGKTVNEEAVLCLKSSSNWSQAASAGRASWRAPTLGNMSMLDKISDYSVEVQEGPNPVADTPAWDADGTITGHDREQTVWTLVHAAALFALTQAPKSDVRLVAGPEAFPQSVADRIREIAASRRPRGAAYCGPDGRGG